MSDDHANDCDLLVFREEDRRGAEPSEACPPNPFERYGLDPLAGPAHITERLRELAEDCEDELERAAIREAWEALTLHPRRRLELALDAHPESRPPLGRPPRPRRAVRRLGRGTRLPHLRHRRHLGRVRPAVVLLVEHGSTSFPPQVTPT